MMWWRQASVPEVPEDLFVLLIKWRDAPQRSRHGGHKPNQTLIGCCHANKNVFLGTGKVLQILNLHVKI